MRKKIITMSIIYIILLYFNSDLWAKEVKYDRSASLTYASQHCATDRYNHGEYKCWNGDLPECVNYRSGRHVDCANFASQALIAGGIDFSLYDYGKPYAVSPVVIGNEKMRTIGFPSVSDLIAVIKVSYCFEIITDTTEMQRRAKAGDILRAKSYSHVMVYTGSNQYCAHTTDRCVSPYTNPGNFWKSVILFHFQDDDTAVKCIQLDDSLYAKVLKFSSSAQPRQSGPGGDHPDDTFALVTASPIDEALYSNRNAPIGLLNNGFPFDMLKVLSTFKREARLIPIDGLDPNLVKEMPLLIIPSGGLAGLSDSQVFKALLEEYVRRGGNVLVFTQQHGYEFSLIPGGLTGYGWNEDQSCQANSSSIDTWHQVLSGQTIATPSLNVDGYFTSYPENAMILMRRIANGQPALVTYPYGNGRIIASSAYTDFAFTANQTSSDEIKLIRDIVSWATKPEVLPEIKPGEPINLNVTITNSSIKNTATAAWLEIFDPDLKEIKSRWKVPVSLDQAQSIQIPINYSTVTTDQTGIYHIKYSLFAEHNILLTSEEEPDGVDTPVEYQLQAPVETDSGRFVVSNPPQIGAKSKDFQLAITSPNQEVFINEPFVYTLHILNNTNVTRNLTLKTVLPHTGRTHAWAVTAAPNGETTVTGSDLFIDTRWMFETLRAYLYDENGAEIGSYMLSFKGMYPAVNVTTTTGKGLYAKGETVNLSVTLKNSRNAATSIKLGVTVTDPSNSVVYATTPEVTLPANGTGVQPFSFPLTANAQGGVYSISTEVMDSGNAKIGGDAASFELPLSQVSVTAGVPAVLTTGANRFSFTTSNSGKIAVNSGILEVSLNDPDGAGVAHVSTPFTLAVGQSTTINVPANIPALKFGVYALSFSQNDETKSCKATTISLANTVIITTLLDNSSYRIRETANLTVNLTDTGKFNFDKVSVTVSVPDAGYADTKTITLGPGQALSLQFALQLPATMTAGQHNGAVTLTLPGWSTTVKSFTLTVPQSSLTLSLNQTAYTAGSVISPVVTNSGGVDTQAQYKISLYDAKSALIADKSLTETIPANGVLALNLSVPAGAADGGYTLVVSSIDQSSGKSELVQKPLSITGVKAALALKSDKPSYLNTESITGFSSITNPGTLLQGGNLHLQVSTAMGMQREKLWTSKPDFQQGVRDGVDTFGVNDSLLPDDDFDSGIDAGKWGAWGTVQAQNGKVYVDSTVYGSGMNSSWAFDGDFDAQVDFSNNSSCAAEGAEFSANGSTFGLYVKNTVQNGRESGALVNGNWTGWRAIGGYQQSGTLRIVRTGSTITGYNLDGTGWTSLLAVSGSAYTARVSMGLDVWRGQNCPATGKFDNFKVNSGLMATINETTDSVRLLRMNDNFDDGVLNTDRWSVSSSASVTTNESNGVLITASTPNGVQSDANVAGQFPLAGDFDLSVDWSTPVAPSSGDWGAIFQISEMDTTTVPDNRVVGNAIQIKRAYINGLGQIYQTGHYNGSTWDVWNTPVITADTSGRFRIKKSGSQVTVWYWNNNVLRWEWNGDTNGYSWSTVWTSPAYVRMGVSNTVPNLPTVEAHWNNFKVGSPAAYLGKGTIRLKQDAGQNSNWQTLYWGSTEPAGTSVKFRTRTAAGEADLAAAIWSDYLTASGSPLSSPKGRWIELEATLATTDSTITPTLKEVTVTYESSQGDIIWQSDVPVNLAQNGESDLNSSIGALANAGKYYFQGTVTSGTGQTVATNEYPFFVAQGNTALGISADKRVYRPGDTVTITGEVKNLAAVAAANLTLTVKGKPSGGAEQTLVSETFTIPAGGTEPFTVTTTAGGEGSVALTAAVIQNGSTLAGMADQYEVAFPKVTATVTATDTAGNDPFTASVGLTNSGKSDATVLVAKSFASPAETVTVPAGKTTLLQYTRRITADTTDTYTFSGDLTRTVVKSVNYGLAGTVALTPQAVYPEGNIAVPVTIANTGVIDGQFSVTYRLTQGANLINQQSVNYYLPKSGNSTDSLPFELTEGNYQLTASGEAPVLAATTNFSVRKAIKTDMAMILGAQSGTLLPVTLKVTNLGYNPLEGAIRLSLIDAQGSTVWSNTQEVSLPGPQSPVPGFQSLLFSVNLSAIKSGSYTIKAELPDNGNKQLAAQAAPFPLLAPSFIVTQLPPLRTIAAGGNATFTFRVKNSGNQEGGCDFAFKADDLADATQSAWLKPDEEKEFTFVLDTAADLEEKDYTAGYSLKKQGAASGEQGVVRYHLAGLKLAVSAALDKQNYNAGDTARLTLTMAQQDAGAAPNLFARINYGGYEEKRSFTLSGSQTLTFNVPLSRITGEKLFYGIYFASGRSLHLNTVYIYKADDGLMVTTDKQVYNPGESVTASVSGTATGDLTLTGPGDFSATLAFNGMATVNFVLPAAMTAGSYRVNARLTASNGEILTAATTFDVAGIQVKVKEALLDKANYFVTDTMQLALTVESNRDISATLKSWVVDPAGGYTEAGSSDVTLTASTTVIVTQKSALATSSTGIHKLVYGIYQGDLLLVSGAKAFDMGQAVLLGLGTDRTDYGEISSPVTVKAELYGTTNVAVDILLDGASIKSDTVTPAGFADYTYVISPSSLTPGRHTVRTILTTGGLTSVKEMSFTYGSSLPDLTVTLSSAPVKEGSLLLTATVVNQGGSPAGATALALHDGDPVEGATPFAVLNVPALAAGASATITYSWNVLGKSGEQLMYAVVDPTDLVTEFSEANNGALTSVSLPTLALGVATSAASFRSDTAVGITVNYANLNRTTPYQNLLLRVTLTDPRGVTSLLEESAIATLAPATEQSLLTVWNTGRNLAGNYTINVLLIGGGATVAAGSSVFTVEPTLAVTGALTLGSAEISQGAPLTVAFTINNSGTMETTGVVRAFISDPQTGVAIDSREQQANLPWNGSLTGGFTLTTELLEMKSYKVSLEYVSQGSRLNLAETTFSVKDSTPPLLTVSTLSDGTYTNNDLLNITGKVTDNTGIKELRINGVMLPVDTNGSFSHPLVLQSGANRITVTAADLAGNESRDTRTIYLDRTAPLLVVTTPADNSKTETALTEVKGSVDDANAVVTVKLGDTTQTAQMTGKEFQSTVVLAPRENTLEVTATDLAANRSTVKRTVLYDDRKPSLAITEPNQDIRTREGNLTLRGTASDPYGLAVTVRMEMDGRIFSPPVVNGQFEQAIAFTGEKSYAIVVTAVNEVGSSASAQRNVIYDKTLINDEPELVLVPFPAILYPLIKMKVPVGLFGWINHPRTSDIVAVKISVTDEYGKFNYSNLNFNSIVLLESWRKDDDPDGRMYTVTAVATHKDGRKTTTKAKVTVPH